MSTSTLLPLLSKNLLVQPVLELDESGFGGTVVLSKPCYKTLELYLKQERDRRPDIEVLSISIVDQK